jgi:hypothetical protein
MAQEEKKPLRNILRWTSLRNVEKEKMHVREKIVIVIRLVQGDRTWWEHVQGVTRRRRWTIRGGY